MLIYREIVRKLEVASTMSNGDIVNMNTKKKHPSKVRGNGNNVVQPSFGYKF